MTFGQQLLSSSNCCLLSSARGRHREQQTVVDVAQLVGPSYLFIPVGSVLYGDLYRRTTNSCSCCQNVTGNLVSYLQLFRGLMFNFNVYINGWVYSRIFMRYFLILILRDTWFHNTLEMILMQLADNSVSMSQLPSCVGTMMTSDRPSHFHSFAGLSLHQNSFSHQNRCLAAIAQCQARLPAFDTERRSVVAAMCAVWCNVCYNKASV